MKTRFLVFAGMAAATAIGTAAPAAAVDTSSLPAYLESCNFDSSGCKADMIDVITAARRNHYGCIPQDLATREAADQEWTWLKTSARGNPKYVKMAVNDVLWAGVTELWPCHKGK